jgi:hypothetical protein
MLFFISGVCVLFFSDQIILVFSYYPHLRLYRLSGYSHTVFNGPSITHKDENFAPKNALKLVEI